ncbi:RNase H domain-containing protein [Trichonephila clavata]|uniref:RNase H domain-containing protein n=1 Tax=Trichonephila clavata TaxID=2740835 RepID=A0A8X6GVK4_TRICU|nr:RNase H domain-containing protein [Trichonephila clavata]
MKTNTEEFRYCFRNPDKNSVFRSELVAIREALNIALDNRASDTWILTDSKSSIQFLKDWLNILDMWGRGQRTSTASSSELQASEVHSLFTGKIKTIWRAPPEHAWDAAKCPRLSLQCTCPRLSQTTLSRLRTGHIKCLIFNESEKTYASCHCSAMASPSISLHVLVPLWGNY